MISDISIESTAGLAGTGIVLFYDAVLETARELIFPDSRIPMRFNYDRGQWDNAGLCFDEDARLVNRWKGRIYDQWGFI